MAIATIREPHITEQQIAWFWLVSALNAELTTS
jgi:hypothetical protein